MMAYNNCSIEARKALGLELCEYGTSNDQQMTTKDAWEVEEKAYEAVEAQAPQDETEIQVDR
jgi:hypothetical protein